MKNFFKNIGSKIQKGWNALKSYKFSSYMLIITIFYAMGSILINLMAIRTFGAYSFVGTFNGVEVYKPIVKVTTAGSLISWLVFACMDIVTEVNGKKKAIQMFWITGILNVVLTGIAALACLIPGTPETEAAYKGVFGYNWGIALASIAAFLLGNYTNALIMFIMKTKATDPKSGKGFTLRVILSTLIGQFIDNAFFYILALAPVFGIGGLSNPHVRCENWGLLWMMVGFTTGIELIVETVFSPLFHKFSRFLISKQKEEGLVPEEYKKLEE